MVGAFRKYFRKLFSRSYAAAGAGGRWPVTATMASQSDAARAARPVIANRAAYLAANAPICEAIAGTWCANLVSDGPSLRSGHPDQAIREQIEALWNEFFVRCDVETGDLVSLLNRIVRSLVIHGEAFVRFIVLESGELRLQLLSPDQVQSDSFDLNIVDGIELGPNGERLAYFVSPSDPNRRVYSPPVRIVASEICHVFEPRFPGQIRGISWLHAVLTTIVELDALQDAALAKAKVSALLAGFVRDLDSAGFTDASKLDPSTLSLEPGTLRFLPPGADISFSPTSDMSALAPFLKHMLRSIAAGCGVPYVLVANDLSDVNYSSARVGLQEFWRRCAAIRSSILVGRLLQPVFERLITLAVLTGKLDAPDFETDPSPYFDVSFLWPQPASLDPLKETNADIAALNAGIRSRQEIIAARGRDPVEVFAEIEADPLKQQAQSSQQQAQQSQANSDNNDNTDAETDQ